jgi:hypothetical protein
MLRIERALPAANPLAPNALIGLDPMRTLAMMNGACSRSCRSAVDASCGTSAAVSECRLQYPDGPAFDLHGSPLAVSALHLMLYILPDAGGAHAGGHGRGLCLAGPLGLGSRPNAICTMSPALPRLMPSSLAEWRTGGTNPAASAYSRRILILMSTPALSDAIASKHGLHHLPMPRDERFGWKHSTSRHRSHSLGGACAVAPVVWPSGLDDGGASILAHRDTIWRLSPYRAAMRPTVSPDAISSRTICHASTFVVGVVMVHTSRIQ